MRRDLLQHRVEFFLKPVAPPILEIALQLGRAAGHFVPPMRVKFHRNHRRVMRPMLKALSGTNRNPVQRALPVALPPRVQDHVMGARHRVDAIKLHKAQLMHQTGQIRACSRPAGAAPQRVALQKNRAGLWVGQAQEIAHWAIMRQRGLSRHPEPAKTNATKQKDRQRSWNRW